MDKLNIIDLESGPRIFGNLDGNVRICQLNAQSIKSKDVILHQYLLSADIDICVITGTWLKDSDQVWAEATDLQKDGYRMEMINHPTHGGGLAIVYKEEFTCQHQPDFGKDHPSFESLTWTLLKNACILNLSLMYRPPGHPGQSISRFISDFTGFLGLTSCQINPIFFGDFNIHVNDLEDVDAVDFNTTIEALGLDQNVSFFMHKKGNTLDLVLTLHITRMVVLQTSRTFLFQITGQ